MIRVFRTVETLQVFNNPLTNLNGIANLKITSLVNIDTNYSGAKLAANTIFCLESPANIFGMAPKSRVCE